MENLKVSDEVWVGTALLHKENPKRESFSVQEILERIVKEFGKDQNWRLRPGIIIHLNLHCLADRKPNPGTYCMLYSVGKERRLFREGKDKPHDWRRGGKIKPKIEEIPLDYKKKFKELLDWYENVYIEK